MTTRPLLAIVPARGGSRGVPNKNMRFLGDRPLLAHTLETVAAAEVADRLVVSSDHEPVLRWAELHGYLALVRPAELATHEATISQVAAHLADELDWTGDVGVFQPTSPFRSAASLRRALEAFRAADVDSMSSSVRDPHLFWHDDANDLARARPLYNERVNRQFAHHRVLRETGSIQLVRAQALRAGREMVTPRHLLFETAPEESLDIDTNDDLVDARRRVERGTVVFRVRANARFGAGHVYNCLQLADELADQRLCFLLVDCDALVQRLIAEHGYDHRVETDLGADLGALAELRACVVVNDMLDTTEEDVLAQRAAGYRVVNVEDIGPGARFADWVVNDLYLNPHAERNVASGSAYAILRSDFHHLPSKQIRPVPESILITFGGTDPGRLGPRCARLLHGRVDAEIRVVVGPGARDEDFPQDIVVRDHVRSMAAEMMDADLILTGAGRTVYEAAATGTPVAVLAHGARDATHTHLGFEAGVVFLGIGALVDDQHITGTVHRMLNDHALRSELSERLRRSIDHRGPARIAHGIRGMLRGLAP